MVDSRVAWRADCWAVYSVDLLARLKAVHWVEWTVVLRDDH